MSGLLVAPAAAQVSPSAAPRGPQIELACPEHSQILVLLQSASAPVSVTIDGVPGAGNAAGQRLDTRTVAPKDMPTTLELTPVIGEKSVVVFVRDAARGNEDPNAVPDALAGYIGCGGWQARLAAGEPNGFLLKRPAPQAPKMSGGQPAPPAPGGTTPAPPPPGTTPPTPPGQTPAPTRRAIGVRIQNINDDVRSKENIPRSVSGIIVRNVFEKSPAESAGIVVGDIITAINDQAVTDIKQFATEVVRAGNEGNAWVTLKVVNARGETRSVRVGFYVINTN